LVKGRSTAHQLAPVKARGGMFAQPCADLPWTQRLSEVWRMRDPDERAACPRPTGRRRRPGAPRRAVDWYHSHDGLHTGDPIAMAHDALTAYRAEVTETAQAQRRPTRAAAPSGLHRRTVRSLAEAFGRATAYR